MKPFWWIVLIFVLLVLFAWKTMPGAAAAQAPNGAPVLVELFTSEGCSSCPPADRLLQELDRNQPVSGAQIIVLSEHVDYWNHIGWKDPWSSSFYSDRQSAYSGHFGLNSVYTPQMVVDGNTEFVGNDSQQARQACDKARSQAKIPLRISSIALDGASAIHAHLETDPSDRKADVFVVVALDHADSQVTAGENSGRRLSHVGVVQSLTKVGSLESGKAFSQDINVKFPRGTDAGNLRLIAFVQEPGPGKVLGATQQRLQKQ